LNFEYWLPIVPSCCHEAIRNCDFHIPDPFALFSFLPPQLTVDPPEPRNARETFNGDSDQNCQSSRKKTKNCIVGCLHLRVLVAVAMEIRRTSLLSGLIPAC
jgi:hypothetical protein